MPKSSTLVTPSKSTMMFRGVTSRWMIGIGEPSSFLWPWAWPSPWAASAMTVKAKPSGTGSFFACVGSTISSTLAPWMNSMTSSTSSPASSRSSTCATLGCARVAVSFASSMQHLQRLGIFALLGEDALQHDRAADEGPLPGEAEEDLGHASDGETAQHLVLAEALAGEFVGRPTSSRRPGLYGRWRRLPKEMDAPGQRGAHAARTRPRSAHHVRQLEVVVLESIITASGAGLRGATSRSESSLSRLFCSASTCSSGFSMPFWYSSSKRRLRAHRWGRRRGRPSRRRRGRPRCRCRGPRGWRPCSASSASAPLQLEQARAHHRPAGDLAGGAERSPGCGWPAETSSPSRKTWFFSSSI